VVDWASRSTPRKRRWTSICCSPRCKCSLLICSHAPDPWKYAHCCAGAVQVLTAFWSISSHEQLHMEPGRYLVSEAGVLLAHVTQVRNKNGFCFVGIDAGMNTLIRFVAARRWLCYHNPTPSFSHVKCATVSRQPCVVQGCARDRESFQARPRSGSASISSRWPHLRNRCVVVVVMLLLLGLLMLVWDGSPWSCLWFVCFVCVWTLAADVMGRDRLLPSTAPGDILLIGNGGAYGAVMASYYNRRLPAAEIVLASLPTGDVRIKQVPNSNFPVW